MATTAPVHSALGPSEKRVAFRGVAWDDYEAMLRIVGNDASG